MTPVGDVSICFTTSEQQDWSCWLVKNLWCSAEKLTPTLLPLRDFAHHFDQTTAGWFQNKTPTLRELSEQAKRICEADLNYPIILSAEGHLMDGKHRLAKALMLGQQEIAVVRFLENPEPDQRHPK